MKAAPARIGQIAITVNGECCPSKESQGENFNFRQVCFGLPGMGSGAPGFTEVGEDPADVYNAAIGWLETMKRLLAE